MKRYLIVTLLCSLAAFSVYAANFTLTVTAPGSGIACDYGPNTTLPGGTVGTDLTTAGMTHCVLNADFTDNSGAHVASGGGTTNWVMNAPSTWLNQCATPSPTTAEWQFWFMWGNGSSGAADVGAAPCNRVSLPLDGATHALSFSYSNADTIADTTHQELILYWPDCGNFCVSTFNRSLALPNAMYYEITYRLTPNSLNQPGSTPSGIHLNLEDLISGNLNPGFHTAWMDPVFGEIGAGSPAATVGSGATSWDNYVAAPAGNSCDIPGKCTAGGGATYDYTNYHTYAWLQTTNGNNTTATAFNACAYVDGAVSPSPNYTVIDGRVPPANCAHITGFTAAELLGHDMRQDTLIGTFCNTNSGGTDVCDGNANHPLANPMQIFIKSIRIFECTNYTGSGNDCGGTLVFH